MKQAILIILSAAFMTGCISTKKYAQYVKEVYKNADTITTHSEPMVSVINGVPASFDSTVKVGKGQTYFIPAIFYWGVKQTFNCELNSHVPVDIFTNECYKNAEPLGLNRKLNGQRLEITVNSLPRQFVYSEKEDIIYIVFFYFILANQSIHPGRDALTVSYKLYNGSTITKQGNVTVLNDDQTFMNNWKSTRKVTRAYLHQYEQNMKTLSRQCLRRIVDEL